MGRKGGSFNRVDINKEGYMRELVGASDLEGVDPEYPKLCFKVVG